MNSHIYSNAEHTIQNEYSVELTRFHFRSYFLYNTNPIPLAPRFCPSVFLYLSSVVPAIWLMELDKIDRRLRFEKEAVELNLTAIGADLKKLDKLLGVQIKLPDIQVDPSMWVTLIEQFLMLILIIGRWMLPKGDLTRDQLSQLLLVYIGNLIDFPQE